MLIQLESADLVPGDNFVATVHLTENDLPLVAGYSVAAKLVSTDNTAITTIDTALTQGTGDEWSLNIPGTQTDLVPAERGVVIIQLRLTGPRTKTLWGQLQVRPAV